MTRQPRGLLEFIPAPVIGLDLLRQALDERAGAVLGQDVLPWSTGCGGSRSPGFQGNLAFARGIEGRSVQQSPRAPTGFATAAIVCLIAAIPGVPASIAASLGPGSSRGQAPLPDHPDRERDQRATGQEKLDGCVRSQCSQCTGDSDYPIDTR
jgi:hypothetical protein